MVNQYQRNPVKDQKQHRHHQAHRSEINLVLVGDLPDCYVRRPANLMIQIFKG
jgi:hypothetical protein